ncbi:3-hydroxyacyl-CoA dehydrogenase NAD-binding domain-containing protein [Candidatus Pelagibacter sp.]|jgi:carnitine 3-dehydrogenase|nr:3-hydroxyacyl-CoA dehydrogenase NAD-binding domain-containing protein [Candidatus Pelagibacter sp.]MDC3000355.1 3-hydroxyacyl-CoA dehydrogenase NAD-binding domain-containing protein [Candidatus Pelagibacter sp.]
MSKIKTVGIVGTGVIGTGWIIRNLAHNKIVHAYDQNKNLKSYVLKEIKRTSKSIKKLFGKKILIKNLKFFNSLEKALVNVDFVQESVLENYKVKTDLIHKISKYVKSDIIISSSSSGLLPSKIFSKSENPQRGIIGHPFNPAYLLPAVEIVPGKKTTKKFLLDANKYYKSISMKPIMLKKELPGYLSDRLQEALWREGLHIINENYATTQELDRAIEDGPGLRYSIMGTFLTFHLAGGNEGMKHMLKQFGPALKLPWTKLKAPKLTNKLSNKLISGTKKQAKGKSINMLSNIRDQYLVDVLKIRKKYENKIRN